MIKKPEHHREAWTPAQEHQLKALAAGNTPTPIIGLKMGRTKEAIFSKASEQNVSLSPTNQSPYNRKKR